MTTPRHAMTLRSRIEATGKALGLLSGTLLVKQQAEMGVMPSEDLQRLIRAKVIEVAEEQKQKLTIKLKRRSWLGRLLKAPKLLRQHMQAGLPLIHSIRLTLLILKP